MDRTVVRSMRHRKNRSIFPVCLDGADLVQSDELAFAPFPEVVAGESAAAVLHVDPRVLCSAARSADRLARQNWLPAAAAFRAELVQVLGSACLAHGRILQLDPDSENLELE